MGQQTKKVLAFFAILVSYYITLFDLSWPRLAWSQVHSAYVVGIVMAMAWNIADKFLKHVNTPDFQARKLAISHILISLLIFPAMLLMILPALGPPRGVWKMDFKLAFLASYFFVTAVPKITVTYERFSSYLSSPKKKEEKNE